MTNSLFVKGVIDQIYPQLQPQNGLDAFIESQLVDLSNNYANAAVSPSINFADPRLRLAYIYQYVAAHARYLAKILHDAANGGRLFNGADVSVACLGGGPGTDALGVLKYFNESQSEVAPQNLHVCVFDKEPAWAQNWQVIAQLAGPPLVPYFQQVDVTQTMTPQVRQCLSTVDLITASYLISEVEKLNVNGVVAQFFQDCFAAAKPGALLVYVDNSGGHTTFFDAIAAPAGWTLVRSWDWEPGFAQWGSFFEDLTPLDGYRAKFVRSYKIASRLSYRVFRKPI